MRRIRLQEARRITVRPQLLDARRHHDLLTVVAMVRPMVNLGLYLADMAAWPFGNPRRLERLGPGTSQRELDVRFSWSTPTGSCWSPWTSSSARGRPRAARPSLMWSTSTDAASDDSLRQIVTRTLPRQNVSAMESLKAVAKDR